MLFLPISYCRELETILREALKLPYSALFREPVSAEEARDYALLIKRPMCLSYILNHFPKVSYVETLPDETQIYRATSTLQPIYTSIRDILRDIKLIFDNCVLYNGVDNAIVKEAERLRNHIHRNLQKGVGKGLFPPKLVSRISDTTNEDMDAAQLFQQHEIKQILSGQITKEQALAKREARLNRQKSKQSSSSSSTASYSS